MSCKNCSNCGCCDKIDWIKIGEIIRKFRCSMIEAIEKYKASL